MIGLIVITGTRAEPLCMRFRAKLGQNRAYEGVFESLVPVDGLFLQSIDVCSVFMGNSV